MSFTTGTDHSFWTCIEIDAISRDFGYDEYINHWHRVSKSRGFNPAVLSKGGYKRLRKLYNREMQKHFKVHL